MDNLDRLDFLYREIEHAKTQLQPHDTGHINTAISWMEHRVREVREEIRNATVHSKRFKNTG
jgi:hypothetical protein